MLLYTDKVPSRSIELSSIYSRLRERFGFLDWWPGDTKDEIVIGAILTQNTSWKNVEKAIENLKKGGMLELGKIADARPERIEKMIRPSGFYRQKVRRLQKVAKHIKTNYGSLDKFFDKDVIELRKELLELNGVGPETADSIILYAAEKPSFVIDAYTKRILGRVYGDGEERGYEELQGFITDNVDMDLKLYQDFHAQFVELGKTYCRKKPICEPCPLNSLCKYRNFKMRVS